MSREQLEQTIHDHFETITTGAGYTHDGSYNLASQEQVAQKLGNLFFDYMVASVFDTSWEGFSDQELEGVRALLEDMNIAQKAGL